MSRVQAAEYGLYAGCIPAGRRSVTVGQHRRCSTEESQMSNSRFMVVSALGSALALASPAGARNPMVGGAPMYPTRNIVQNAVNSKDHSTLIAAVKAAGLVD